MSSRRCYYSRQGRNNNVNFSVILFTNRKQTDEQTSLSKHYLRQPVAEIMIAVERDRQCRLRSVHTLRVHGPWTRPVKTGIQNYTRVHGPSWSPVCRWWPTRPVNTGSVYRALAAPVSRGAGFIRICWPWSMQMLGQNHSPYFLSVPLPAVRRWPSMVSRGISR